MITNAVPGSAKNTVLTIGHGALETIREHLWLNDGNETGGILLGHERIGSLDIIVAGGPGPDAVRTNNSFDRDLQHARALAATAWSEQEAVWIGEWHTHPVGPPHPSNQDMTTYQDLLAQPDLGLEAFVCLIVTPRPSPPPQHTLSNRCVSNTDEQAQSRAPMLPQAAVHAWLCASETAFRVPLHRTRP